MSCFNALYRAYSISTDDTSTKLYGNSVVSMPFIGLIPFLLRSRGGMLRTKEFVSMPFIGLIPFLQFDRKSKDGNYKGFNALYRAYSISTYTLYCS